MTDELRIDLLERRRSGYASAMWQAPALTIAAQSFLLNVLADDGVPCAARIVIAAAGVVACLAALLALFRLRAREVQYSEAIAKLLGEGRDVRPPAPQAQSPEWPEPSREVGCVERPLRCIVMSERMPKAHMWWALALVLFGAADVLLVALA